MRLVKKTDFIAGFFIGIYDIASQILVKPFELGDVVQFHQVKLYMPQIKCDLSTVGPSLWAAASTGRMDILHFEYSYKYIPATGDFYMTAEKALERAKDKIETFF